MQLSISNSNDNRIPVSMWLTIRYVSEEDSVPVERQISQQIITPCHGQLIRMGVIRKIRYIQILLSFDDFYEHDYTWRSPVIEDGVMAIAMQKGNLRPRVSLNGANASYYWLELSTTARCCSAMCCLFWVPAEWFCCCHNNYETS